MEDLCTGCLCPGRKLVLLNDTNYYQVYTQILNEISIFDISRVVIKVCWECRALLRRTLEFRLQVQRSYVQLMQNTAKPVPPRLTPHFLDTYAIDCGLSPVDEPKTEPICDNVFADDLIDFEHSDGDYEPEQEIEKKTKNKLKKPDKKGKKKKKKRKKQNKIDSIDVDEKDIIDPIDVDGKTTIDPMIDEIDDKGDIIEHVDGGAGNVDEIEDVDKTENDGKIDEDEKNDNEVILEKKNDSEIVKEQCTKGSVTTRPISPTPIKEPTMVNSKIKCEHCDKLFSSKKTYRYHINVLHKGNNQYPCPRCGKVYQWKSNLGRHMRTHKAVDAGELYCSLCDKSFASVATYRQHLKISRRHVQETDFMFTCNECGKKFVNKTRLRDHIDWDHLKKIKFRCQICSKPFKCHTSLYVHTQNVHRDREKKDNLCHVCGKSYQNAAKLKYHIVAMHSGSSPYSCGTCGAAFGWYSSLYRHTRELHYKIKVQSKKPKKSKKMPEVLPPILPPHYPLQPPG